MSPAVENHITRIDKINNILNGGPDPVNYDDNTKSLGELCLKRFTEIGDYVMLVNISKL